MANPGEVGLIKAFNNWERGQELHKTIYNLVIENLSNDIDQDISENKSTQPYIFEDLNWQYEKSNWIKIHPGSFVFKGHINENLDGREITIDKGFNIGKFPVTQVQWNHVMDGKTLETNLNQNTPKSRTPIVNISWNDCQAFIKQLNSFSEKHQFRLPTEIEWEYTCKSDTKSSWSFGENRNDIPKFAWYIDSNSSTNNQTPTELGLKPPNPWGIYDMLGNVFEWCQDLYSTKNVNDKINQKDLYHMEQLALTYNKFMSNVDIDHLDNSFIYKYISKVRETLEWGDASSLLVYKKETPGQNKKIDEFDRSKMINFLMKKLKISKHKADKIIQRAAEKGIDILKLQTQWSAIAPSLISLVSEYRPQENKNVTRNG